LSMAQQAIVAFAEIEAEGLCHAAHTAMIARTTAPGEFGLAL
jgi:hypothetical protein